MDRDELLALFAHLEPASSRFVDELAMACARGLGATGCGISLVSPSQPQGSLGASGPLASQCEELQSDLGEGPGIEAVRDQALVEEPDLAGRGAARWVAFGHSAAAAGVRATFAVPLGIGAATVGALTVYEDTTGPLTADQRRDLHQMSAIVTQLILALQSGADAGALAKELADVGSYHPEVHQATGMVAARMGVPVADALIMLRARAYADDVSLAALARDVVSRRVRFDPE